jgi:hypothetical protein
VRVARNGSSGIAPPLNPLRVARDLDPVACASTGMHRKRHVARFREQVDDVSAEDLVEREACRA